MCVFALNRPGMKFHANVLGERRDMIVPDGKYGGDQITIDVSSIEGGGGGQKKNSNAMVQA